MMFSVMAVAGAIGAPLGGVLSDKIGRRRTLLHPYPLCLSSSFGSFLFWVLLRAFCAYSHAAACRGVLEFWVFADSPLAY
jgi:MFS family permease